MISIRIKIHLLIIVCTDESINTRYLNWQHDTTAALDGSRYMCTDVQYNWAFSASTIFLHSRIHLIKIADEWDRFDIHRCTPWHWDEPKIYTTFYLSYVLNFKSVVWIYPTNWIQPLQWVMNGPYHQSKTKQNPIRESLYIVYIAILSTFVHCQLDEYWTCMACTYQQLCLLLFIMKYNSPRRCLIKWSPALHLWTIEACLVFI